MPENGNYFATWYTEETAGSAGSLVAEAGRAFTPTTSAIDHNRAMIQAQTAPPSATNATMPSTEGTSGLAYQSPTSSQMAAWDRERSFQTPTRVSGGSSRRNGSNWPSLEDMQSLGTRTDRLQVPFSGYARDAREHEARGHRQCIQDIILDGIYSDAERQALANAVTDYDARIGRTWGNYEASSLPTGGPRSL